MKGSNEISKGILQAIFKLAIIFFVGYILITLKSIFVYLLVAGVFTLISTPVIHFLETKLKLKTSLAIIINMIFFIAIFVGLISLIIPVISTQTESLSKINYQSIQSQGTLLYAEVEQFLLKEGINLEDLKLKESISGLLDFSYVTVFLNGFVSFIGSFTLGMFSVLFMSFFFMKDSQLINRAILITMNVKYEDKVTKILKKVKHMLSRYFVGLLIQTSLIFLIYFAVLIIFGIQNALIIGLICAILNLIPYIGPLIGSTLMFLLSLTSGLGTLDFETQILPTSIYVVIGSVFAQMIDNFINQPLIFSKSTNSHPLEIFIVILGAGMLVGITGMIVAVPAYTSIKVILKEFFSENRIVKSLTTNL